MIADAISWLTRQLFYAYQIVMLALVAALVASACWALLNWHDPGLVHLKALWADMQKPPAIADRGL